MKSALLECMGIILNHAESNFTMPNIRRATLCTLKIDIPVCATNLSNPSNKMEDAG
jgi:hypothetical protein